jgi:hypothetical protein
MHKAELSYEEQVSRSVARIKAGVLALIFAFLGGVGLFITTAWLILRGGPNVGLHLQLLSNYFIGYSVTWGGCFVGLFYGALVGGVIGWTIGMIYNRIVKLQGR